MKFLYLEDNLFNQLLMKHIITKQTLDIKSHAHNLLDYIRNYDVLLLDWHLNHINGDDVVKMVKKHNINIKIIVITADTNPVVLKNLTNDNLKYFNKPLNIIEFKNYLEKTLDIDI